LSIIRTINLTKRFRNLTAVDGLNLEIEEGEIFGLLGPNGAGKTTALLVITTVLKPTEGTAIVGEYDVRREPDKARRLIGIAFQEPKLLWVSTPWDVLNWHAKVCGLSAQERRQRVRWILEEFNLWDDRRKGVHELSGGMRKRVEVAKIMIQRPKIAIIDEPTAQIDVIGKHRIWSMIKALRDEGSTIVLATNELYEADKLSDRVAIMHRGRLLVCDNPQNLKDSIMGGDILDIRLDGEVTEEALGRLKDIKEVVKVMTIRPNHVRVYLNQAERVIPKAMRLLMEAGTLVSSISMTEPSLDDVFLHYTGLTIEEAQGTRPPWRGRE